MANSNTQKGSWPLQFERECKSWLERLPELYDEAKERSGGNSLTIYGEVSQLLDYLDGTDEIPDGFDLFQECDNLASRLHAIR